MSSRSSHYYNSDGQETYLPSSGYPSSSYSSATTRRPSASQGPQGSYYRERQYRNPQGGGMVSEREAYIAPGHHAEFSTGIPGRDSNYADGFIAPAPPQGQYPPGGVAYDPYLNGPPGYGPGPTYGSPGYGLPPGYILPPGYSAPQPGYRMAPQGHPSHPGFTPASVYGNPWVQDPITDRSVYEEESDDEGPSTVTPPRNHTEHWVETQTEQVGHYQHYQERVTSGAPSAAPSSQSRARAGSVAPSQSVSQQGYHDRRAHGRESRGRAGDSVYQQESRGRSGSVYQGDSRARAPSVYRGETRGRAPSHYDEHADQQWQRQVEEQINQREQLANQIARQEMAVQEEIIHVQKQMIQEADMEIAYRGSRESSQRSRSRAPSRAPSERSSHTQVSRAQSQHRNPENQVARRESRAGPISKRGPPSAFNARHHTSTPQPERNSRGELVLVRSSSKSHRSSSRSRHGSHAGSSSRDDDGIVTKMARHSLN